MFRVQSIVRLFVLFSFITLWFGAGIAAADFNSTKQKLETAMSGDRPEPDRVRDGNRKPIETLESLGLRDDMKVFELLPSGDWIP